MIGRVSDTPVPRRDDSTPPPAGRSVGAPPAPPTPPEPQKRSNLGLKVLLTLVTIALLALVGFLGSMALPRWWAYRVGDVVDQKIGNGVFAGVVCGFVFTAIPLLLLRRVFTFKHSGIGARTAWLLLAVLFAAPNLITLFISLGTSNSAHDAQRIMSDESPAFRTSALIGAVFAAAAVLLLWVMLASRRRRRKQIKELQANVADRDAKVAEAEKRAAQTGTGPVPDPADRKVD